MIIESQDQNERAAYEAFNDYWKEKKGKIFQKEEAIFVVMA